MNDTLIVAIYMHLTLGDTAVAKVAGTYAGRGITFDSVRSERGLTACPGTTVSEFGGRLHLDNGPPGGARVVAELPLPDEPDR